jgi:hypothetical protein
MDYLIPACIVAFLVGGSLGWALTPDIRMHRRAKQVMKAVDKILKGER